MRHLCRGASLLAVLASLALHASSALAAGPEGALDARAWELVSPVEKNGGEVQSPAVAVAGPLQAAAAGGAVAFGSESSFGEAAGAAPVNQYVASRGGGGWSTANVTPALLSGTYDGDPYLLFSADLSRAVVSGGWRCRADGSEECEAENPPLGPGGPAGYRNAYLREGSTYTPLITAADFPALPPQSDQFHLAVQGASPDLRHVVLAAESGLYEWSEGALEVELISATPGASLAAPGNALGAVSENGQRVYFTAAGALRLREGGADRLVAAAGEFGAASADGSVAFYLEAGHVRRYDAVAETSADVTPSGGATAVLGASPDGAYLFYVATGGIYRWHAGAATKIVNAADLTHLPPQTGAAAVAADGARFFFTAADPLLPLRDSNGRPDAYEWEAQGTGSCTTAPGCLGLLSSGRTGSAAFAAASATGDDAYFLTASSLLPADPSAVDLYDARAGGGFPEPQPTVECLGDDCQGPPFVPQDPAPATSVVSGPVNPPLRFSKAGCPKGKRAVERHGRTVCATKKRGHRPGGHR
jgi:hypothetical protein